MAPTTVHSVIVALACALAITLLPASSHADDASRISFLELEIQKLRTQLGEQDRRIQRLEAELERRASASVPDWKPKRSAEPVAADRTQASGPLPWHFPEAWNRVAKGMTQEEVERILGEPTAVEAVDGFKTLFYREANAGGESIGGHVNLREDRVVAIKKPARGY